MIIHISACECGLTIVAIMVSQALRFYAVFQVFSGIVISDQDYKLEMKNISFIICYLFSKILKKSNNQFKCGKM